MVQCGTKGDVFLDTIDTTGNHKDHTYVATQILSFEQKFGVDNVVQIYTDNALVMSLAYIYKCCYKFVTKFRNYNSTEELHNICTCVETYIYLRSIH